MKSKITSTILVCIIAMLTACSSTSNRTVVSAPIMDSDAKAMYLQRIIPAPKSAEFKDGNFYRIAEDCHVELVLPNSEESKKSEIRKTVNMLFQKYWDVACEINFKFDDCSSKIKKDGYLLSTNNDKLIIKASDIGGIRNALKTVRQLSESERGTTKFNAYVIPQLTINDYPTMQFRGIHLCYFPETTFYEFVRAIRLAAYYKMNYVVVEFWGTYKFKDYPQFGSEQDYLTDKQIDEMRAAAKEAGITIIPQFNMLGHAYGAREITGKHAILYRYKNLQNHFEPEAWSWCISNPDTKKMLVDMMVDLHERFDRPPFFHIGFDESYEFGTCALCRKTGTQAELIKKHLTMLHSEMKKRNVRLIMWHDMLLDKEDPRWDGYIVCGRQAQKLTNLYKELPKDIVIADWQYRYPKYKLSKDQSVQPQWPTMKFFKANGFDSIACPWIEARGTDALGKAAKEHKLLGMLGTTWGQLHFTKLQRIFSRNASWNWSGKSIDLEDRKNRMSFNHHVHQLDWDMGCTNYKDSGYSNNEDLKMMNR